MVADISTPQVDSPISLNFRPSTGGEEFELVRAYVRERLTAAHVSQRRTVFIEPELETGYPDLVAAYWNVAVTRDWPASRVMLLKPDLRILHSLVTGQPRSAAEMQASHGTAFLQSLERLFCAELVFLKGSHWYARSPRRSFAVRRLVAIEAKVGDWKRGLWQAVRNTWFASESYLLLPTAPTTTNVFREAARLGIGLLTAETPLSEPLVPAPQTNLPASYASWLFNEWAWRLHDSGLDQ